jgi:hypothetical protein
VVQLVLQRGRSYEQIAELLKISEDAVRARAHAGLSALAGGVELPADKVAPLADFLLGQRNGAAPRELLEDSPAAREWAETVRESLAEIGEVPELPARDEPPAEAEGPAAGTGTPAAADTSPRPRPRPRREARPPKRPVGYTEREGVAAAASSRLGGALLLGGAVLEIVVVVLVLFVFGGGDDDPGRKNAAATPTPTASATPQPVGQVELKGAGAARKANGVFALFLQGEQQLLFAVQIQNMPPTPKGTRYALWLTGPGNRAKWIGDTPDVAKDGVLLVQGPRQQDTNFTKDIGRYRQVLVTSERGSGRKQPGTTLARGTLQQG